jgi:hypothetical protein
VVTEEQTTGTGRYVGLPAEPHDTSEVEINCVSPRQIFADASRSTIEPEAVRVRAGATWTSAPRSATARSRGRS